MSSSGDAADARKQILVDYGLQVLENLNNADEEERDKGKAMMANYVEEVVRGQIELIREYTESAIDLESEARSEDEDDSYLATDDEYDEQDDMDSRLEVGSEEEEEPEENEEYKDDLFSPEDALERYAQSLAARGF